MKIKTYNEFLNESEEVKPEISKAELINQLKIDLENNVSLIKLRKYFNVLTRDTLIYYGCIYSNLPLVQWELNKYSIKNCKKDLLKAAIYETKKYNPEILATLLKRGVNDIGHEIFRELCEANDIGKVKIFFENGNYSNKFSDDISALKIACDEEHLEIVKMFIEFGFLGFTKGFMRTISKDCLNVILDTLYEQYSNITDIDEIKNIAKQINIENGFPADSEIITHIQFIIELNQYTK